jgi:hypothetical protein
MMKSMKLNLAKVPGADWLNGAIAWVKAGSPDWERPPQPSIELPNGPPTQRRNVNRRNKPYRAMLALDKGNVPVQGLDFDENGAAVLSQFAILPGSVVFIKFTSAAQAINGMVGFAYVRDCTRRAKGFAIRLEFNSELMEEQMGSWVYKYIAEK